MTDTKKPVGGYSAIVYKEGNLVIAEDYRGKKIAEGEAGVDDASVIQSAVDVGGKIVIRKGLYILKHKISIPSNTYLEILGTLKLADAENDHVLYIPSNAHDIVIDGKRIGVVGGNRENQTGGVLGGIVAPNKCNAHRIIIQGIKVTNCKNWPLNLVDVHDVIVRECEFSYSGNSPEIAGTDVDSAYNCWFINCVAHDIDDHGITLYGGVWKSGVVGCISYRNATGISCLNDSATPNPEHDIVIAHNICYENGSYGIDIIGIENDNYNILIANNITFKNNQNNGTLSSEINLIGSRLFCEGNIIHSTYGTSEVSGINVGGTGPHFIRNNAIFNIGQGGTKGNGIFIQDTAGDIVIENNYIGDTQENPTMHNCIIVWLGETVSGYLIIKNNYFGAQPTRKINIAGTANNRIIKHNFGYITENSGTATFNGDGSTTQFSIAHGLVSTPSKVLVTPMTADAAGDFYVTADADYIYINYKTAPPSGTDNVKVSWYAEV